MISSPRYVNHLKQKNNETNYFCTIINAVIISFYKANNVELAGSDSTIENFISLVRSSPDKPLDLEIIRDNQVINTKVKFVIEFIIINSNTHALDHGLPR